MYRNGVELFLQLSGQTAVELMTFPRDRSAMNGPLARR